MTTNGQQHAFRWTSGTTTDLGTLSGFTGSSAADINTSGQMAGTCTGGSGGATEAFRWSGGTMSSLGTLGGFQSSAAAINDAGVVVGTSLLDDEMTRHAFVWDTTDGMLYLGDLDANNASVAADVNDAGDVVGDSFSAYWQSYYYWYYYWVEGPSTATLWRDGDPIALDGPYTRAFAVNDATAEHGVQVVGEAYDWTCGEYMPVLWEVDGEGNVTSRVLDESLDAAFTGYLRRAGAINDSGQIAVSGESSAFAPRALRLTPSAQPPVEQALHAPRYLSASPGVERVTLWWSGVCDADSYTVKRGTIDGGPYSTIATGITQTSYTDTSAPLGTTYHYVVCAVRDATPGANSPDAAAAPLPYGATGLTGKALNGKTKGQVSLNWTKSVSTGVANYKVFRINPTGPHVQIATVGNVSSYTATGLAKRTRYGFYVVAVHSGGQTSAASNTVYVTAN
jgi:probable HAF family extracellular repeat protein